MMLNEMQQKMVEENLGLVGKVIKDRVHGLGQPGFLSYEDLYQIGCVGLCKAAATDKGGCFSTYAYRLIWNEICDVLIKTTRLSARETSLETETGIGIPDQKPTDTFELIEFRTQMEELQSRASGCARKGIACLLLSMDGYSSQEIGRIYDADPAAVRMWMTKGRRFLKSQPELQEYAGGAR